MKQYLILCLFILLVIDCVNGQATTSTVAGNYAGTGGVNNSFYGYSSGRSTTGYHNVFLGAYSGYENGSGSLNVYIGSYSGYYSSSGTHNACVGTDSGYQNNGLYNSFFGNSSGYRNNNGSYNVFLGAKSGFTNSNGQRNVFLGCYAGYNETSSDKLYIDNSDTSSPLIYGDFLNNILTVNGNLGVGTNNPDSKLTVAGNIHAREVKVTVGAGADFVFEDDYSLPSLIELETFIKQNKHLPEIASEKEMQDNGLCLAEMNIKLLQKVEELTLYTIAQEHQFEIQENTNEELKERLLKLETIYIESTPPKSRTNN